MDITQLLAFVMQNKASDLHLSAGNQPIVRVNGQMKRVKTQELSSEDIRSMLYSVMTEDQRAAYEKEMDLDFAISFGEKARFRVNAFNTRLGTAAVFRTIPSEIPTMEELNLPKVVRRMATLEKGIVLITGGTGSGKSTTLAAMINYVNMHEQKHVLTIEDPVEFFHTSQKSLINHREVGEDTKDFKTALKSALREDPDVILVGEMRDHETISLALTAAETGHLVFGTLHANSAHKTIDRLIDVFPGSEKDMIRAMLASSLQGVIAQTLVRTADGKGRAGVFEILVGTGAVRNLIRENQIPQLFSMMQTGSRYGMQTMEDAIQDLLASGVIDKTEARRVLAIANDADDAQEEGDVSVALGGGRVDQNQHGTNPGASSSSAGIASQQSRNVADEDEGYSF
ncbi:MAG: type IV pili twitching motility protein PilT [Alphaproteobacteria bacterium]|nr:type IV pili twitching motility protein PilT [Alphaproteobacteria bacterium]